MKIYTAEELKEILTQHKLWLDSGGVEGKRANLRGIDLNGANLSGADLREVDLRGADLSGVNLSEANLSYTETDKRYIQITCIGSRKGMTTYCFEDDIIWCGCFTGTLEEFETKVRETHENNEQYLKEYLGAIEYIKKLR